MTPEPEKQKYYFTFGQNHTHRHNDLTLDCDSVVTITATDQGAARGKMFDLFGAKWSFCYTEERFEPKYFPRGVVLELEI